MSANSDYVRRTTQAVEYFERLMETPLRAFGLGKKCKNCAGVYVLFEDGAPVYVGRSRNIAQRFRSHVTPNHNSASFAFKRTREIHDLAPSYKTKGSRQAIVDNPVFRVTFLAEIEKIKQMEFRFIEVDDHIDQYLLELYATLALDLDTAGFDTH